MPLLEFTTIAALIGLVLLIPIIILYLLKPKPKHVKFPSVMFILDTEKKRKFQTFLKKIFRDPLLIMQLLIISALVLAIAGPFFISNEEENSKENAVVIIDSSASMQATDMEPSRFNRAASVAGELMEKMNEESSVSIVLAESAPVILAKNQSKKNALSLLKNSFVGDSPSDIADTILFSKDLFSYADTNKKVYVFSDFSSADESGLKLVQKILSQINVSVNYVKVKGEGKNVGIIDAKAKRFTADRSRFYLTFTVKNYLEEDRDVEADIILDGKVLSSLKKKIEAGDEKLYSYDGSVNEGQHKIEVMLKENDHLSADNKANLFLPAVKRYKVLLISDEEKDIFLRYALQSSKDIDLKISIPPVIPSFEGFDVIIFGDIRNEFILPGTFRDAHLAVNEGSHAVFIASNGLMENKNTELAQLLPVEPGVLREKYSNILVLQDHEIFSDVVSKGSKIMPEIVAEKWFTATAKNQSIVLAAIEETNSPAISYMEVGRGKTVYMGLNPSPNWSNIYHSSSFPVFWIQLLDWLTREETLLGVNNFRTGDYLPLKEDVRITTPSGGTVSSGNMLLDEAGFYYLDGANNEVIAASLLDELESDISKETMVDSITDENLRIKRNTSDVKKELLPYLLVCAFLFIIIETYYYRRRGLI